MLSRRALFGFWLLTASAGCDTIFSRPFEGDDDPAGDASNADAAPDSNTSTCLMPAVFAAFEVAGAPPCDNFGAPNVAEQDPDGASMLVQDGQLVIAPQANAAQSNGCTVDALDLGAGVFVHVTELFAYPRATTYFRIFSDVVGGTAIESASLIAADGLVALHGPGGPVDEMVIAENQWWRLRPDGSRIVGEVSPDGETWTEVGDIAGLPPDRVKLVFGATVEDTGAVAPGVVRVESINVCP